VYTDELSVNTKHTIKKKWKDKTVKTPRQAFLAELSTGLSHLQDADRILPLYMPEIRRDLFRMRNSCFCAKEEKNADAQDEIDGDCYEKYFVEQVLGNISPESVIAVESAS
jgi:hypothetical protein